MMKEIEESVKNIEDKELRLKKKQELMAMYRAEKFIGADTEQEKKEVIDLNFDLKTEKDYINLAKKSAAKINQTNKSNKNVFEFIKSSIECLLPSLNEDSIENIKNAVIFLRNNKDRKGDKKNKGKGGTNILSGLKKAFEILIDDKKNENNNEPMEEMRVKTVILLSDGYDNDYDTEEIVDEVKKITKGQNLSFTLHTFGYGDDYDSKLMSKLALIRDGTFNAVEDVDKIQEYFVNALGGCMSTIYQELKYDLGQLDFEEALINGIHAAFPNIRIKKPKVKILKRQNPLIKKKKKQKINQILKQRKKKKNIV